MRRATPRLLALLAVAAMVAGLFMLGAPAFASGHPNGQASPSSTAGPSDTATASPSTTSSGGGTPVPGTSSAPTGSASASPSESAGASESASPQSSVLGEQIPQTGAGYALPLLLGGTALAIVSFVLHRRLSRSSS
jgi:LPXTG-motif cell wall-anchored protein